jgi:hypothetical protein
MRAVSTPQEKITIFRANCDRRSPVKIWTLGADQSLGGKLVLFWNEPTEDGDQVVTVAAIERVAVDHIVEEAPMGLHRTSRRSVQAKAKLLVTRSSFTTVAAGAIVASRLTKNERPCGRSGCRAARCGSSREAHSCRAPLKLSPCPTTRFVTTGP